MTWQIDDCPDANGFSTIRPADSTAHGDTDAQPVATVYRDDHAALIAAAPDLAEALHSLLGELRYVHAHGDVRDSIRNSEGAIAAAVAALVKAGTSLPVVDGDVNADTYGTATTAAEAVALAGKHFADPVVAAECYGPIHMANGDTLPLAWVALTSAEA